MPPEEVPMGKQPSSLAERGLYMVMAVLAAMALQISLFLSQQ